MKFRIDDYIHFTVPNNNIYVIPEPNIVNNSFGIQVQNNIFNKTINKYFKFSEMDYGFGYKAYFWIIINLFLIFFAIQRLKHYKFASYAILILLSGLIYILQIFPVTIATDYRYYYWLVIATLIGALVIVIDSPLKSKK
jgi:hypothetical protein